MVLALQSLDLDLLKQDVGNTNEVIHHPSIFLCLAIYHLKLGVMAHEREGLIVGT